MEGRGYRISGGGWAHFFRKVPERWGVWFRAPALVQVVIKPRPPRKVFARSFRFFFFLGKKNSKTFLSGAWEVYTSPLVVGGNFICHPVRVGNLP